MIIFHIALGGCLTAEPILYGATPDTGGHIAYVMAAAAAQARRPDVERVEIFTRRFHGEGFPDPVRRECSAAVTDLTPNLRIRRFASRSPGYLSKEDMAAEIGDLAVGIEAHVAGLPRLPHVIHAHFSDAARIGLRLRDRFGIPLIYTPHSLAADKPAAPDSRTARARRVDERRALARADAVVVSSRDEGERQIGLYSGAGLARVRQIRPGCDLVPGAAGDAAPLLAGLRDPGLPMILAISRPVAKKNLGALARAYAGSDALRGMANLVILAGQRVGAAWGCADERQQIDDVASVLRGLDGQVALPAAHSRDEVRALYAYAASVRGIFVNPALVEPFGLTTLEAARAGLPCVVPLRGGAAEVAAQLGHGLAVDTTDIDALTGAMLQMLAPDRHATAVRAAAQAAPSLGWDHYAEVLQRLIASLRPASPAVATAAKEPARRLLVSDIDGTLTGDRDAAARLADLIRSDPTLHFVAATGRSVSEAWRVLDDWALPRPEALITSAGSEVYYAQPGRLMSLDRGYAARATGSWQRDAIAASLSCVPGLALQAGIEQRRWKLGYLGCAETALTVRRRLLRAGLAATVVHSHQTLIDVMPAGITKQSAVAHLAARLGFDRTSVIVAGDSGNDLAMLTGGWNAIVLGDDPDLAGLTEGPHLYRARAPHAGGVIEGLAHYAGRAEVCAA